MLKEIDLNQPLSVELCEFIGAYIGDGFQDRGKVIGIVGNKELDLEYLRHLNEIVFSLFGFKGKFIERKNKNAVDLRIYSKRVLELLTARFGFPNGEKTYTVQIPKEILENHEKFVFATIRGIFDTDGCVFFDKRKIYLSYYPRITLNIASKPLADQLKQFLSNYFAVSFRTQKRKNPNKSQTYYVEVYGHSQLNKWMELIGFSNKRNLNQIIKWKPLVGIEPTISPLPMAHSTTELQGHV